MVLYFLFSFLSKPPTLWRNLAFEHKRDVPLTQRQDPKRNLSSTPLNSLHTFLHPLEATVNLGIVISNTSDILLPSCSASFPNSYSPSTLEPHVSSCLVSRILGLESQPTTKTWLSWRWLTICFSLYEFHRPTMAAKYSPGLCRDH